METFVNASRIIFMTYLYKCKALFMFSKWHKPNYIVLNGNVRVFFFLHLPIFNVFLARTKFFVAIIVINLLHSVFLNELAQSTLNWIMEFINEWNNKPQERKKAICHVVKLKRKSMRFLWLISIIPLIHWLTNKKFPHNSF